MQTQSKHDRFKRIPTRYIAASLTAYERMGRALIRASSTVGG